MCRQGYQPNKPLTGKPHGGTTVQKPQQEYSAEQLYKLSQLLPLEDQTLLLQHLVGSLASKLSLSAADIMSFYDGLYSIQRSINSNE